MFETKGLTKHFGGLRAVEGLDLRVEPGERVGLIGPNGAGKTTVFNLATGFLTPTRGTISFNGQDITRKRPHVIASLGMVRTFQATSVFAESTVLDNVIAGYHLHPKSGFWESFLHTRPYRKKVVEIREEALELIDFVGLTEVKDTVAGQLSHGHKRTLGIAIALAAQPRLLLMDEPLSGMHAAEVDQAMALMGRISEKGVTILLIEHNMRGLMGFCERVVAISFGKKIAEGTPSEIQCNEEVIEAYLGCGSNVPET